MENNIHFAYNDHRLLLTDIGPSTIIWCKICGDEIHGKAYSSIEVSIFGEPKFIIHEKCGMFEREVKHPFHPHPLILSGNQSIQRCCMCKGTTPFFYSCPGCHYCLDVKCASLIPGSVDSADSMVCCQRPDNFQYSCDACLRVIEGGVVYYDARTRRLLHESCSNLPELINHPFHQHHLTLVNDHDSTFGGSSKSFRCNACGRGSLGYYYRCPQCEFYLDVHCAFLVPNGNLLDVSLHTHEHPLVPCEQSRGIVISCSGCEQRCKSSVYVCIECHLVLDDPCKQLPSDMVHPFHQHRLSRTQASIASSLCKACDKAMQGFMYACLGCNLAVHTTCALPFPPTLDSKIHSHPLVVLDKRNTYFRCNFCSQEITDPFCCCLDCKYYLHLHCLPELPSLIYLDKYSVHPLRLSQNPHSNFDCIVCTKTTSAKLIYSFKPRIPFFPTIEAHVHCCIDQIIEHYKYLPNKALKTEDNTKGSMAVIATTAAENGHLHPLVFVDEPNTNSTCNFCSQVINDPFCWCEECEYYLHPHCLPDLPLLVFIDKHAGDHPLFLEDPRGEDYSGRVSCDVCGERMNLVEPTYTCEDCDYDAHIHCCMDQIVESYKIMSKQAMKNEDQTEDQVAEANNDSLTEVPTDPAATQKMIIATLELEIAALDEKMEALKKQREEKVKFVQLIGHMFVQEYDNAAALKDT